ncbi:MAG: lysophospholipase, partial [Candidatus Omnitrophota bacterium]
MGRIVDDKEAGIMYEKWEHTHPRAVLLLVHGLGAHTGRWNFLAGFFLARGISSYAIALKGFGKTPPPKGHIDSFNTYVDDVIKLRGVLKKKAPSAKVFILGESMGALISFIAAGLYPDLFAGLICFSPAFGNRLKFSAWDFLRIFSASFIDPKKQFHLPFDSGMCTRDKEYSEAMDRDPDELRTASSKLLTEIFFAQVRSGRLSSRIKKPVLFQVAGNDMLVDPEASVRVFSSLETADKTLKRYPEMRHALSVELD